jgi:two-component system LytT family response regulator
MLPAWLFSISKMPNSNGFGLLEKQLAYSFEAIFIIAYDHYAIQAIKFSAMDFAC